jgi:hypothetical protein
MNLILLGFWIGGDPFMANWFINNCRLVLFILMFVTMHWAGMLTLQVDTCFVAGFPPHSFKRRFLKMTDATHHFHLRAIGTYGTICDMVYTYVRQLNNST